MPDIRTLYAIPDIEYAESEFRSFEFSRKFIVVYMNIKQGWNWSNLISVFMNICLTEYWYW